MNDLISRQAAIDEVGNVPDYGDGMVFEALSHAQRDVSLLPSAQPERKTGKWIKKDCDLLYCSECDLPSLHPWPYCEWCGAKMEVEHT